jgi:hypothetical protein
MPISQPLAFFTSPAPCNPWLGFAVAIGDLHLR